MFSDPREHGLTEDEDVVCCSPLARSTGSPPQPIFKSPLADGLSYFYMPDRDREPTGRRIAEVAANGYFKANVREVNPALHGLNGDFLYDSHGNFIYKDVIVVSRGARECIEAALHEWKLLTKDSPRKVTFQYRHHYHIDRVGSIIDRASPPHISPQPELPVSPTSAAHNKGLVL